MWPPAIIAPKGWLDVPRANTLVVMGADLFGLSQLHRLRGRAGRGRLQGLCYLMTEGEEQPGEPATPRRQSLATFDRLGSGMAIAALDLRGAGDLVGEEQAGHLRLIGLGLDQPLMSLAIREAKGEVVEDRSPEIHEAEAIALDLRPNVAGADLVGQAPRRSGTG